MSGFCCVCQIHPAHPVYGDKCEDCWVDGLLQLGIKGQPSPHAYQRSPAPEIAEGERRKTETKRYVHAK